jgi:acetylornithine deacetylase
MGLDDLATLVRERRADLINILADLVRVARDGHDAIQDHVARALEATGAEVDVVEYLPRDVSVAFELGAPSLIEGTSRYVVGRFGQQGDHVLFWAHSDSEPLDAANWTRPPFDAIVEGSRMYGWGIGDDLVGVAMMIAAARLHQESDALAGRAVAFASVPSKRRAQAIIHALDRGYGGAGTVYLHPAESGAGLGEVKGVTSGLLRFRVRVRGRRPDTTEPGQTVFLHTAVDPMPKAAAVISAIQAFGEERAESVYYGPIHDVIGRSTNVHVSHVQAGSVDRLSNVPEVVDLFGSMTFPPTEVLSDVQEALRGAIARLGRDDAWLAEHPLEWTWLVGIQGSETPSDSDVFGATFDAIHATTGSTPHVNTLHAASDIRNPMLHKGIPTVGIGPLVGDLTVSGGVDEWADIEDYLRGVEVVVRIARAFRTGA